MPWQGVSTVDLRLRFIGEYLTEHYSMTELAASYGISRKTAYYWVRQYERDGPGRLAGASRRPHHMPRATADQIVDQVLAARRRHPTWGAGKLRDWLMRRIEAAGATPIVIRDTPRQRPDVLDCLYSRGAAPCATALQASTLDRLVTTAYGVELWDFTDRICPDDRCPAYRPGEGIVVFRDDNHLTDRQVRSMAGDIFQRWDATLRRQR